MGDRLFASPGHLARFLAALPQEIAEAQQKGLEQAAKLIEREAKAEIGIYQGPAGPFAAWRPLAQATREDRVRKGYTPNDPLLRTGDLRDSITHEVGEREAVIGSDNQIAVYQELGTRAIPARSFLGGAAVRKSDEVAAILGRHAMAALVGAGTSAKILPVEAGN